MLKSAFFYMMLLIPGILWAGETRLNSLEDILRHHFTEWFSWDHLQYTINMIIATFLGWIIGSGHKKPRINVGPSTFASVCLASSLGAGLFLHICIQYNTTYAFGALGGLVSGLGFIAGAVILKTESKGVFGLTSAASIWATAIVGVSVGIEFYLTALLSTIFIFLFLRLSSHVDE